MQNPGLQLKRALLKNEMKQMLAVQKRKPVRCLMKFKDERNSIDFKNNAFRCAKSNFFMAKNKIE